MKKLFSTKMLLLYTLTILSLFLISRKSTINQIHYLAIGDGYSKGINAYGIIDYGYSDYLKDILIKTNRIKFYTNEFSKKDLSIKMLQSNIINNQIIVVDNQKIALKEELQNSDLITLSIGLNDLIYQLSLEPTLNIRIIDKILENAKQDYEELIKEIRKYYKKDIYVVGYPNHLDDYYLSLSIRKFNNYLANNKDLIYITPINNTKYYNNPKSNYPTKDGYQVIATKIYKKYIKTLEK